MEMDRARRLADEIWNLARSSLLVNLRFLDTALFRLELRGGEAPTLQTEGSRLYYNVKWLLKEYRQGKERVPHAYLHVLLHCIYRHMFVSPSIDRRLWDVACDIAVENAIGDMNVSGILCQPSENQALMLKKLKAAVKPFTAEKLYRFLRDAKPADLEIGLLENLFRTDDHSLWYQTGTENSQETTREGAPQPNQGNTGPQGNREELEQMWKEVSHRVQVNMETLQQGRGAGSMLQELQAVNREKYDYESFLRRFMTSGEVMRVNDDEFDYIFYTYGLALYDNLPLIEPLEYKEVKRIREFVIAIDTSGSTSGALVQKFLNKTYNIMKQQETFFTKINLHIIQCDASIQEAVKITCQEEFDAYLAGMKIRGLGGTDFRPVFRYVDQLIHNREFMNLKGLIYFTDGFGTFPTRQPDYEAAFVFLDDNYNNYQVPPWAIKLILQSEEL